MSDRPESFDLSHLDTAATVSLDPQTWKNNLAALADINPSLARVLEATALPAHWRPVRALDDSLSWRIEKPDEPPAWLGGTAVPRERADSLLAGFRAADQNPTLPTVACGAELDLLLQRLPHYRAVYVFEEDPRQLAAVLRTRDFAAALRAGRCHFVPADDSEAHLDKLLGETPGLLPPGNIAGLPGASMPWLEHVRSTCERTAVRTNERRARRLAELGSAPPRVDQPLTEPRLALTGLQPGDRVEWASAALTRSAGQIGWASERFVIEGPNDVHPLAACERLGAFTPTLTVSLNHEPARLAVQPPGAVVSWYLSVREVPDKLPEAGAVRLGASPRVCRALAQACDTDRHVEPWLWGCEPEEAATQSPVSDSVALVGTPVSGDPDRWGVVQPSHRQLWRRLREGVRRLWDSEDGIQPETLLAHAEAASGVQLEEPTLRRNMLRLIELAIIPEGLWSKIVETLRTEPIDLLFIGSGWESVCDKEMRPSVVSLDQLLRERPGFCPRAAIFAGGADPLTPELLRAGMRGWPILLHSPGRKPQTSALGGVLHPDQHYAPFDGGKALRQALQACHSRPEAAAQRADRTRQHLLAHHTWERRLEQLQTLLFPGADEATS